MENIWTLLTQFITNIFSAITGVLDQLTTGNVITMFVIVIPLFGIAVGLLFRFLRRRRA